MEPRRPTQGASGELCGSTEAGAAPLGPLGGGWESGQPPLEQRGQGGEALQRGGWVPEQQGQQQRRARQPLEYQQWQQGWGGREGRKLVN